VRQLLVVLLVVASATVHAADPWTYGRSEHFEVFTTGNAGRAREVLRHFEDVHAFLASFLLKRPLATRTPTRLIIFSNDRQFAPYRPNESAAAFYLPGFDRDHIVMGRFDPTATQIVVHEYVHLILRHNGGRYPTWLNEGLAEFFSTMVPESERMTIGEVPQPRFQTLFTGSLIPVARLLAVNSESPEYNTREHSGMFYAESWALTHMLLAEDTYRTKSDEFIQMISRGTPGPEVFKQLYGKSPDVVERDLRNYLTTNLRVFRPAYPGPPARATYETRPADAFEAGLVTANLLANTRSGETAARAAFTRLEEQKPNDLGLLESRGYFELRRNQRAAARRYFERAVAQGTQSVALMRDYLALDPSVAEAVVPKALALAPDDVDIRVEEASLLVRKGRHHDALATLAALQGLTRAQEFRASQLLVNIFVQANEIDAARRAAARVTELARSGREKTFASQLSASVERITAQRTAFDEKTRAAAAAADVGARVSAASGRNDSRSETTPSAPLTVGPSEPLVTVTGRISSVTSCSGGRPIVEVLTNGQTLRLGVDDPLKITVRGRAGETADLACGQHDTPVTIGYVATVDKQSGTAGSIRVLDYGK
jgi:hypothetical protein